MNKMKSDFILVVCALCAIVSAVYASHGYSQLYNYYEVDDWAKCVEELKIRTYTYGHEDRTDPKFKCVPSCVYLKVHNSSNFEKYQPYIREAARVCQERNKYEEDCVRGTMIEECLNKMRLEISNSIDDACASQTNTTEEEYKSRPISDPVVACFHRCKMLKYGHMKDDEISAVYLSIRMEISEEISTAIIAKCSNANMQNDICVRGVKRLLCVEEEARYQINIDHMRQICKSLPENQL